MDCHVAANSAPRPATATEYVGADLPKHVAPEHFDAVVAVEVAAARDEMVDPRKASFLMMRWSLGRKRQQIKSVFFHKRFHSGSCDRV
jgi:hypothetical protein